MPASSSTIGSVCVTAVWERLGGGPLRGGRGVAWWRDGDSPTSISLDSKQNVWCDHARGSVGGGVLKLVRTVLDCDKASAVRWLCEEGFIENLATSPELVRKRAQKWAAVRHQAENIRLWRRGLVAELETAKADAVARDDELALAISARELFLMETNGAAVVARYRKHLATDPAAAARLIQRARDDAKHAQAITAKVVLLLGILETRDV
jgi:hypothetical protein